MLVLSVIANIVVTNTPPFLDGAAGLALVPQPLATSSTSSAGYQ